MRIQWGKKLLFETFVFPDTLIDLQPLSERREELCLKLAKKCLKNNIVKDMFPLNEKSHKMDLRNTEKYVVKHANTEQLKKSAIPFIQRLSHREDQNNH